MDITITLGWWLLPLTFTMIALWWLFSRDYSGDYNFSAAIYTPVTGMWICASWMIYFGLGWALS